MLSIGGEGAFFRGEWPTFFLNRAPLRVNPALCIGMHQTRFFKHNVYETVANADCQ